VSSRDNAIWPNPAFAEMRSENDHTRLPFAAPLSAHANSHEY